MEQVEIGEAEHLPLQHLDLAVLALDGTGVVAEAEPGDDGVEGLFRPVTKMCRAGGPSAWARVIY